MSKLKIDIDAVLKHIEFRKMVNNAELSDIVLVDGDEEIPIPPEELPEWKFTGLSNLCLLEFKLGRGADGKMCWTELES